VRAIEILFATIIAFGVVYNSTRISLSERNRELATLRVIGFTRAEISYILLGEVAMITLLAVPLGLLVGYGLSAFAARAFATELFRIPLVIEARTYAFSAATVVAATAISALIVRHRLDHLDLVAVLKMRE
jgi:putative ABC transport system permease protein